MARNSTTVSKNTGSHLTLRWRKPDSNSESRSEKAFHAEPMVCTTLRWRETDSNHRSRRQRRRPLRGDRRATTDVSRVDPGLMIPSTLSVRHLRSGEPREPSRRAVPMVRIRFPPAESQVQTCLSREFAFLGREAAVFRGCPGRDERPGSTETRGRGIIWPKGGDISVGPYSSTAPSVMRSVTMPRILSRMRDPP